MMKNKDLVKRLMKKGVRIPSPESVEIGPEVDPDRIAGEGVVIHSGCRLFGAKTLLLPHVELGYEAPVTLDDCQVGRGAQLKGGFFSGSCFLERVSVGSGAQVREACLLEEEARCAHGVGLKHTILMPFVVLGSLVNFCDCLMSGGTDAENHSEVGSSYIHFNYTPNRDKATASLIGDVPSGVMINQPPVFLGGQGGLVGPVKIVHGAVVAAGIIVRKDILKGGMIMLGHALPKRSIPFVPGLYMNIRRIITMNAVYIANLIALRRWYLDVRPGFSRGGSMEKSLLDGAVGKLESAVDERLKRLGRVAARMPESIARYRATSGENASGGVISFKREFYEKYPEMEAIFRECLDMNGEETRRDEFLSLMEKKRTAAGGGATIDVIKALDRREADIGTEWLEGIVESITRRACASVFGGSGERGKQWRGFSARTV